MWSGETIVLTLLALVAFAANSLLNRMALAGHPVDATSYTAIRLASGAAVLVLLVRARAGDWRPLRSPGLVGPLALFAYALPFRSPTCASAPRSARWSCSAACRSP